MKKLALIHRQYANSGPSGSSDAKPKLCPTKTALVRKNLRNQRDVEFELTNLGRTMWARIKKK